MAEVIRISDAVRIDETALLERLTANLASSRRMTDMELVEAEKLAVAPLPTLQPCDDRHLSQCLRIMRATLPRENADDVGGELFVAAYRRKLAHMPADQINFMTDAALERCKWFPTIKGCLDIAAEWERNDEALRIRGAARAAVLSEKQQRMEEAMARLEAGEMTQAELSALPEKWQRIADARGLVIWSEDGFLIRPPRRLESQGDAA